MLRAAGTAELVAIYLGAFGTVSAVLLALYLQVYLVRARRPRLRVEVSGDPDDGDMVAFEGFDTTSYIEFYLRVRVRNAERKRSANGTRALLLTVAVEQLNGSNQTLHVPDCLFKWSGPSYAEDTVIPSGTWRRLDMVRYRREPGGTETQAILVPALNRPGNTLNTAEKKWPPSKRNRLDHPGHYRIEFVVSCDEGDPTFWRLSFTFDPGDHEPQTAADLSEHIRNPKVQPIPAPRLS